MHEMVHRVLTTACREGKIKYIGLSMISSNTLRRASKVGRVDAIQTEHSVFMRDMEGPKGTNLLSTARELGVAVVLSSPLGRGMLTSNFGSGTALQSAGDMRSAFLPRFHDDNRSHNEEIVRRFAEIAARKGCTVPQLTLAWLLKQGDDIFPIPGTKKMQYLEQNWAALDVDVTDVEYVEIDTFSKSVEVAGGTLPPQFEEMHFRDTPEEKAS
jgi:aryl-alcohol dehydrogenase-like predicted oxidoreductase